MSTILEAPVTLSKFGADRRTSPATPGMTVADLLAEHGMAANGHRVARNGNPVALDATIHPNDELTIVPRVQGG
jgi:sulfur carrier protein ThiS